MKNLLFFLFTITSMSLFSQNSSSNEALEVLKKVDKNMFSETQIVSICPTDFDGDGIVDNIDLDLDNDGILNSIESTGNVKIDLSSISSPVLMFPTVSFTTSATYTSATSSTFTGAVSYTHLTLPTKA